MRLMNTHRHHVTREESAAIELLKSTGVGVLAAAQIACAALKAGHGRIKRTLQCLTLGEEELKRMQKTVTFKHAVATALEARKDRRPRTLSDFRYVCRRFIKRCPGLAAKRMRSIRTEDCARYIHTAFDTPSQRAKARRILSALFGTAYKRGWCSENPVARVEIPRIQEERIRILRPNEITNLLHTAAKYEGGKCLAAVGLMLYAGIRPHEVARLTWQEIDTESQSIAILPRHSKTGGARCVSIQPPLARLLQRCPHPANARICPTRWQHHWRRLRRLAGWNGTTKHWQPDALRHTFASYHLRHFRDYAALQYETGHRDSSLLRTRYVDMRGVINPALFWQ